MARRTSSERRQQDNLRALYDAALESANPNTLQAIRFAERIAASRDAPPVVRELAGLGTFLLGLKGYGEIYQWLSGFNPHHAAPTSGRSIPQLHH